MNRAVIRETLSVLVIGLCLSLIIVAAAGSRKVVAENQWPIQWIEVRGEFLRVSAEQVRAAAAPLLQDGFFSVELPRVRKTVESLSWVREAEVRKLWPDQVIIRVLEHEPLARWDNDRLVSRRGDVFSVEGMVPVEGLPLLHGPEGSAPEVIAFFNALRERLPGTGLDVQELELTTRGGWRARLSGETEVVLGRDAPMERMDRFIGALDDLRADPARVPALVDLRYTNGFAVRWRHHEDLAGLARADAGGMP